MKPIYISLLFIFMAFFSLNGATIEPHIIQLVELETQFNAIAHRQATPLILPHYEIPLRLLNIKSTIDASPNLKESMIFEKNSEPYVRWVVNPEDTQWYLQLEAWMRSHQLDTQRHYYFQGYQTASRSYIAEDPTNRYLFSLKGSTNQTGGKWADKKQTFRDGIDIIKTNDLISFINVSDQLELENFGLFFQLKTER